MCHRRRCSPLMPIHIRADPLPPGQVPARIPHLNLPVPIDPRNTFMARCYDADCVSVVIQGRLEFVRLAAIDAPEKHQPFGWQAADWLHSQLINQPLRITPKALDRYQRTVAFISTPSIPCVSLALVQHGLAWFYPQYGYNRIDIQAAHEIAKASRIGLWSDDHPIPPWEFRHDPTKYPRTQPP